MTDNRSIGQRVGLAAVVLWTWMACAPGFGADAFDKHRAALRARRQALRQKVSEIRSSRIESDRRVIADLIDKAHQKPVPGAREDLEQLLRGYRMLDEKAAEVLEAKVTSLPEPSESVGSADLSGWRADLRTARRKLISRPMDLLNKTINLGATDLSFDFYLQVLAYHPDAPAIRRGLKQTKILGKWRTPYEAARLRAGQRWDSKYGWILTKDAERYEKGEVYDYASKKWMSLEEANKLHSDMKNPWVFRTEHLEMRGTAPLPVLVQAAEKLEKLYAQIFAVYAKFFMVGNPSRDFKAVFAQLDHKPLEINIYKDKADYRKALPRAPQWSSGMYTGGASHFFGNKVGRTMYHEFCHHVLAHFSRGGFAPAWLSEGIAVYTEHVRYDDQGRLQIGGQRRRGGKEPLESVLALETFAQWTAAPKYSAAGKLVWFCMESNGRQYRDDFIDFLRDSYRGRTSGKQLWDYLGLSKKEFAEAYKQFLGGAQAQGQKRSRR